jgi:hypothetical protein
MVVILPDPWQFRPEGREQGWDVMEWNERLTSLCRNEAIDCIDLYPSFRDFLAEDPRAPLFYPHDGHPTVQGHFRIAEALFSHVAEKVAMN